MHNVNRVKVFSLAVPLFLLLLPSFVLSQAPRVIEITATKDNKFRCPGQKGDPVITVKPGEVIKLRFTTFKGPEYEKDGTAHDFTIKEFRDQGWSIRLKEGVSEHVLVVPDKPGEYMAGCYNVKCGKGHDEMLLRMIIKP